ncbi:MAG: SGNH/GDSL hydrolase family protein [Bacteroides sp.]|nr:SGNH/GDSL hydrolase family protein [Bacteroides sp.]
MKAKLFLLGLLLTASVSAQIVYHDAAAFPLLGKTTDVTITRYERLPASLENVSRKPLWELGRNSAGLAVRFRSNSTRIAAKWEVLFDRNMNHMTPTGIKGLDLYCLQDGKWVFAGSGRPQGKVNEATIVKNMLPEEREYLLYLSLYDGVTSLSIGVDTLSEIGQPAVDLPVRRKPVVFYGTSILQGCCASRPGMAHTNILERWLNRECINLGFSGNALLDLEIADVIAGVDASMFVLDFVPNATVEQMKERAEKFYSIIRSKHPDTPILFVEDPIFTHSRFDREIAKEVKDKNETLNTIFRTLKKLGDKNIYLLASKDIIGHDGEATVDGVHFTDLGFMRYAEVLYPVIKKHIEN